MKMSKLAGGREVKAGPTVRAINDLSRSYFVLLRGYPAAGVQGPKFERITEKSDMQCTDSIAGKSV